MGALTHYSILGKNNSDTVKMICAPISVHQIPQSTTNRHTDTLNRTDIKTSTQNTNSTSVPCHHHHNQHTSSLTVSGDTMGFWSLIKCYFTNTINPHFYIQ